MSQIVIQDARHWLVSHWSTIVASTGVVVTFPFVGNRIVHVVGDIEVEETVTIVVDEAGARAPPPVAADSGALRDIAECSVAVVVEELIGGVEMGDEDVGKTVVVV